jgi:hypothetical protein
LQLDASWETFDSLSEKIRFKFLEKPDWLLADENLGTLAVDPFNYDLDDYLMRVQAFDPKGRITEKTFFIKNQPILLTESIFYTYENDSLKLFSKNYPGGVWSGDGVDEYGQFYASPGNIGDHSLTYTVIIGETILTQEITVHVKPTPQILITGDRFCDGDTIRLVAPAGYDGYVWSNGDTSDYIDVSAEGEYQVTIYDGELIKSSKPVTVLFEERPETPTIDFHQPNSLGSNPLCSECEWSFNGVILPEKTGYLEATQPGKYNVRIKGANGCYSLSSSDFDFKFTDQLDIYPNPNNGTFSLQLSSGDELRGFRIVNAVGEVVLQRAFEHQQYYFTGDFFLGEVPAALYIIYVETTSGTQMKKLVKDR